MPSKDNNENCFMHPKVDNREIIIWNDTDEFIETLFDWLLQRYQLASDD